MRPSPARFPVVRLPSRRTVAVVLLATVVGLAVHRTTSRAAATAERLGTTTPVAVVVRSVPAGATLDAGDVRIEARPSAHVPEDAVVDDPTGLRTRHALVAGEVLVTGRLAGGAGSAAAALVPEGSRAVAIPSADADLPVEVGDTVDVVASFDPSVARHPTRLVAAGARVVAVDDADGSVTVAVPVDDLSDVAFALTNGIVVLALAP